MALVAGLALGWGPAALAQGPAAAESTEPLQHVIIGTAALPYDALAVAVAQRVPGPKIHASTPESFDLARGRAFVYVEVARVADADDTLSVTAILADGRAFVRSFSPDPDDPTRSTASVIANLIVAIEQEAVAPTQLDAPLPPEAQPEPVDAPAPPEPPPEPPLEPVPAPVDAPPAPPPRPPPHELGIALVPEALIGLRAPQLSGAGEALLMVRLRRGLLAAGHFRYSGRPSAGAALHRLRVAASVGYAWRRDRFVLTAAAGPSIEPWLLTEDGRRSTPQRIGGGGRSILFGGHAWIAPALHGSPPRTRAAFDVGARATLSVSALGSGSDVRINSVSGTELFTLGGPELTVGLWTAVWLPVGRR